MRRGSTSVPRRTLWFGKALLMCDFTLSHDVNAEPPSWPMSQRPNDCTAFSVMEIEVLGDPPVRRAAGERGRRPDVAERVAVAVTVTVGVDAELDPRRPEVARLRAHEEVEHREVVVQRRDLRVHVAEHTAEGARRGRVDLDHLIRGVERVLGDGCCAEELKAFVVVRACAVAEKVSARTAMAARPTIGRRVRPISFRLLSLSVRLRKSVTTI